MTLRTDPELDAALTELAKAQGLSKQEVIRRAVLDMRVRTTHRALVDRVSDEMLETYGEALDRLGRA